MNAVLRSTTTVIGILITILAVAWSGLKYPPKSLPPHPEETKSMRLISIPSNLPKPVERHFDEVFDLKAPAIETAVVWGKADLRISGIWAPALFKAYYYIPGHDFMREMEITWFGKTVFKGKDSYINGKGSFGIGGKAESGEKIDSASNLTVWAEAVFAPTKFIADPKIRWQVIDDNTAKLIVPLNDAEDTITVKFDPETGLMSEMRAPRYRSQELKKAPWIVRFYDWREQHGIKVPQLVTVGWADENEPRARFKIDGIEYNVGVTRKIPKDAGQKHD